VFGRCQQVLPLGGHRVELAGNRTDLVFEPVLECANLLHRSIDVVLRIVDVLADGQVGEDVVEEDVRELEA
jgi:hypothetical protein